MSGPGGRVARIRKTDRGAWETSPPGSSRWYHCSARTKQDASEHAASLWNADRVDLVTLDESEAAS